MKPWRIAFNRRRQLGHLAGGGIRARALTDGLFSAGYAVDSRRCFVSEVFPLQNNARGESGRKHNMLILGVSPVGNTLDDASRALDPFDTFEGKLPRHPRPIFVMRVATDRTLCPL